VELRERIEAALGAMKKVQAIEQQAARARVENQRLKSEQPAGSVLVWLPGRMEEHFSSFGISIAVSRLARVMDEPETPGYQRVYWVLGIPVEERNQKLPNLLFAVADIEDRNPYIKVIDFAIRPEPTDPRRRIATVNIAALVSK
jgi:hypothetical protein